MWNLPPDERRKKRCFHRVISGLEKGGDLRIIVLTSSDDAINPIQRDFRRLVMRLKRRSLVQDYIKVIETADDGRDHIHMIFRGDFIAKAYLTYLWEMIHQSPVTWIQKVKPSGRDKRRVATYLAKYMAKELHHRYSWSWGWVYKGFVRVWREVLALARQVDFWRPDLYWFPRFLDSWQKHLRSRGPPDPFRLMWAARLLSASAIYKANNKFAAQSASGQSDRAAFSRNPVPLTGMRV